MDSLAAHCVLPQAAHCVLSQSSHSTCDSVHYTFHWQSHEQSMNHISGSITGCYAKSPTAQDTFWPIPRLINKLYCANATRGVVYVYVYWNERDVFVFFCCCCCCCFALWKTLQGIRLGLASYQHTWNWTIEALICYFSWGCTSRLPTRSDHTWAKHIF